MEGSWPNFQQGDIPVWNTNVMISQGTNNFNHGLWDRPRHLNRIPYNRRSGNYHYRNDDYLPPRNMERSQSVPREVTTSDLRNSSRKRYYYQDYNDSYNGYQRDDNRQFQNRRPYDYKEDRGYHKEQDYSRSSHSRMGRFQNQRVGSQPNILTTQKNISPPLSSSTIVCPKDLQSISPSEKINHPKLFGGFQSKNESNKSGTTNEPVKTGKNEAILKGGGSPSGSKISMGNVLQRSLEEKNSNNYKQMLEYKAVDKTVYTLKTCPPFDGNTPIGGDRIKAKVIHVCEYCNLFTYDDIIEKHMKTLYHYNKVKEYLMNEEEKRKTSFSSVNISENQTAPSAECHNLPNENGTKSVNNGEEELELMFSEDEDSPCSSVEAEAMEIVNEQTSQMSPNTSSSGPSNSSEPEYYFGKDDLDYT